jgi:hypothetical protein
MTKAPLIAVIGGLGISREALSQLAIAGASVGVEQAVDDYIAQMDEKWGAPWDVIRPALIKLVIERGAEASLGWAYAHAAEGVDGGDFDWVTGQPLTARARQLVRIERFMKERQS